MCLKFTRQVAADLVWPEPAVCRSPAMEKHSRIQRWFGTADACESDAAPDSQTPPAGPDLRPIRSAMTLAMAPCTESHRLRAALRIELANSAVELWLIRADVFQYLAQDLGQKAAAQEITRLDPLFKGLVPELAACPGSPDNRAHERHLH